MALFAIAGDAGRAQIVPVVRSAARLRVGVFDFPRSPGSDDAVVYEANLAAADVAVSRGAVVDGVDVVNGFTIRRRAPRSGFALGSWDCAVESGKPFGYPQFVAANEMLPFGAGSNNYRSDSIPAASGAIVPAAAVTPKDAPMPLKIAAEDLQRATAELHLADDGDSNERKYWAAINEAFPNYELFWQRLVVQMTRRIELPRDSPARSERRNLLADDVWRVSYVNYSLFLHLAYASDHLALLLESSFGDFYTHLDSVCDLAEDFLLAVHLLVSECHNAPVPVLQGLSREEFLEMAADGMRRSTPKRMITITRRARGSRYICRRGK
jgi:hypothetical protein